MSELSPDETIERAREAAKRDDLDEARDLYQEVIDEAPYSEAARRAGEELMQLKENESPREAVASNRSNGGSSESTKATEVVVTDIRLGFTGWFRVLILITLASIPIQFALFFAWNMLGWAL